MNMRIRNKQRFEGLHQSQEKTELHKTTGITEITNIAEPEFFDVLERQQSLEEQKDLNELLQRLDEFGQRLANSFSIYDLKSYHDTLKNFLRRTAGKAYEIKEERSPNRHGKTKILQRIELINQELEELSKLVLAKQKVPLEILEKLDCIRGIVVDLFS